MPIMKFNFPQPVTEDTTHRVVPAVGSGANVAVQSQAFGDPVEGSLAVEAVGDHVQPAGLYSTAPYKPDTHRPKDRAGRCTANDDTCNGYATKRWPGLCAAHGMQEARSSTSQD
jgi:hypothetical protein